MPLHVAGGACAGAGSPGWRKPRGPRRGARSGAEAIRAERPHSKARGAAPMASPPRSERAKAEAAPCRAAGISQEPLGTRWPRQACSRSPSRAARRVRRRGGVACGRRRTAWGRNSPTAGRAAKLPTSAEAASPACRQPVALVTDRGRSCRFCTAGMGNAPDRSSGGLRGSGRGGGERPVQGFSALTHFLARGGQGLAKVPCLPC